MTETQAKLTVLAIFIAVGAVLAFFIGIAPAIIVLMFGGGLAAWLLPVKRGKRPAPPR